MEYSQSIQQLRCWSEALFGYVFTIIHRLPNIMKDFDGISRHIDFLIYRFPIQANYMYTDDMVIHRFTYNCN